MKRLFCYAAVILVAFTLGSQDLNSQSTCQGIYHDGVASNSWFGDKWDDAWGLDWEAEAKACVSSKKTEISMNINDKGGGVTAKIEVAAVNEISGCGAGSGSCCEKLCESGAGL